MHSYFRHKIPASILFNASVCTLIAFLSHSRYENNILYNLAISFGFGFSFLCLFFVISRIFPEWRTITQFALSIIIGMIVGSMNMMFWLYVETGVWITGNLLPSVLLFISISVFLSLFFISQSRALTAEAELKNAQKNQAIQEKSLIDSQLRNLQSQVEPHFLFNTLANVQVLIDQDPIKAKLLLKNITNLLRSSLNQQRKQSIRLQDELSLLDTYLSIQQIRLADRLSYAFHVEPHIDKTLALPPYLIQPIIENAVIHGIEPSIGGGHIDIFVRNKGAKLIVEVTDNGIGFKSTSKGNGLSLKNIRQRLDALYGKEGKLVLSPHMENGFTSKIELLCVS